MGRGGMFGMMRALTGEALPGSRPVLAEGNLLRKGPVIFLLPQAVIDQVREHALPWTLDWRRESCAHRYGGQRRWPTGSAGIHKP